MLSFRSANAPNTLGSERYFLLGEFIVGVGFGLQLVLWFLCTSYLWRQRSRGWKVTFLIMLLVGLLVAETTFAITQAWIIELMYIEHRDDPGPWTYFLAAQGSPVVVLLHTSLFLLTFIGDLIVLWRCWVIWSAFSRRTALAVTCVPMLTLATSFAVGIVWIVQSTHADPLLRFETIYYGISIVLNILLTSLITLKLLSYRHAYRKLLPKENASQYLSLAAIVIESAAIHTTFAIAFIIPYGLNAPINELFVTFASAAQQVATYLIIYRVADGKAWAKSSSQMGCMTSVVFASRVQQDDTHPSGLEQHTSVA